MINASAARHHQRWHRLLASCMACSWRFAQRSCGESVMKYRNNRKLRKINLKLCNQCESYLANGKAGSRKLWQYGNIMWPAQ